MAEGDERYHFRDFDPDLMIALGRLTLCASYLEGCVATMLARLLDNNDLEVGKRLAADASFRWLIDHTRAISEHRLPEQLHEDLADWLRRSAHAYSRRNRIVHSDWAVTIQDEEIGHIWVRASARGKRFQEDYEPVDTEGIHEIAKELEALGLEGVRLMGPVQELSGRVNNDPSEYGSSP